MGELEKRLRRTYEMAALFGKPLPGSPADDARLAADDLAEREKVIRELVNGYEAHAAMPDAGMDAVVTRARKLLEGE